MYVLDPSLSQVRACSQYVRTDMIQHSAVILGQCFQVAVVTAGLLCMYDCAEVNGGVTAGWSGLVDKDRVII